MESLRRACGRPMARFGFNEPDGADKSNITLSDGITVNMLMTEKHIVVSLIAVGIALAQSASALDYSTLAGAVDKERAARYEVFRDFQIRGICGATRLELAAEYGANTIRTYVAPSREKLDEFHRMGFKVIVGIWMPHQGENKDGNGTWNYDYQKNMEKQIESFTETVDRIGDHPAVLMFCLGNEVHLGPLYLKTANRMSQVLHRKFPNQLSSITIINAPSEKIAMIKEHAPDLDVIGYNSYGHGAVGSSGERLEQEWGRAYYVSEFGPQGPWWGLKAPWGAYYEQSYDAKIDDLQKSFQKIDSAPHCLGSTMFLWGFWAKQKPTYFSAFLSSEGMHKLENENEYYITPMVDEFCRYWSGNYPAHRAPVLESIQIESGTGQQLAEVRAGERFKVSAKASDPDTQPSELSYRWWILDQNGKAVAGPVDTKQSVVELEAPTTPGTGCFIMAYVIAPDQRASGFTVPFMIKAK